MNQNNKMLGDAVISRLLFKFSVPCVMGLLISALYNIVDQIFIGNSELGYLGNAATGVSFPVLCIANAFAWCVGDGAASYLSICAGRKDTDSAHKCVSVLFITECNEQYDTCGRKSCICHECNVGRCYH